MNSFSPTIPPNTGQNRDGKILIHGDGKYGYYIVLVFRSQIEKRQHVFQHPNPESFSTLLLFDFGKMTCPIFFDMYLMNFDIHSQYLVRFRQYFVKNH